MLIRIHRLVLASLMAMSAGERASYFQKSPAQTMVGP
jgi:hypothetical protein